MLKQNPGSARNAGCFASYQNGLQALFLVNVKYKYLYCSAQHRERKIRYTVRCNRADIAVRVSSYNAIEP